MIGLRLGRHAGCGQPSRRASCKPSWAVASIDQSSINVDQYCGNHVAIVTQRPHYGKQAGTCTRDDPLGAALQDQDFSETGVHTTLAAY